VSADPERYLGDGVVLTTKIQGPGDQRNVARTATAVPV
jgi:hypothetical protein